MTVNPPPAQAFTVQYAGRVFQITIDVGVSEAFDPASGPPSPPAKTFKSIWDTGATNSVISRKVVSALGLKPTGVATANTANGQVTVSTFLVNIYLPNKAVFVAVRVTEASLVGPEDVLIGMDIISVGDFSITNTNNQTCVSFRLPSLKKIDYVEEVKKLPPPRTALSPDNLRKQRNQRKRWRKGAR
jgi:predicted aspartyl protease